MTSYLTGDIWTHSSNNIFLLLLLIVKVTSKSQQSQRGAQPSHLAITIVLYKQIRVQYSTWRQFSGFLYILDYEEENSVSTLYVSSGVIATLSALCGLA